MATILVVDDDEHIREFLRKSLSSLVTVVEAADGAQAVAAARWSKPQIVVMDLEMPVLDGFEAARQIKTDPATGNPMLIALTGAEAINAVPRARAAGFSYFVHKEVNARVFVEKIVRLVKEASGIPDQPERPPELPPVEPAPVAALPPPPVALAAPPEQPEQPEKPESPKPKKPKKPGKAKPRKARKKK